MCTVLMGCFNRFLTDFWPGKKLDFGQFFGWFANLPKTEQPKTIGRSGNGSVFTDFRPVYMQLKAPLKTICILQPQKNKVLRKHLQSPLPQKPQLCCRNTKELDNKKSKNSRIKCNTAYCFFLKRHEWQIHISRKHWITFLLSYGQKNFLHMHFIIFFCLIIFERKYWLMWNIVI